MERIRPIKYITDWSKIPLNWILQNMETFNVPYEDIRKSNPWVSDKEFQEWLLENRGSATEPVSDTKILRLRPANTPFPELNKIFQTFRPERLNFTILAKGTGYPPHRDVHRTCNINFIAPGPRGRIMVEDIEYNYDRFVLDPSVKHAVESCDQERFTMMASWSQKSYTDVCEVLEKDGWL
jgi:hypothetical protein